MALDAGGPLTLNALLCGQIEVADVFSTDPAMAAENLVALEDAKHLFLAENIIPVINEKKARPPSGTSWTKSRGAHHRRPHRDERAGGRFEDMGDIAREWLKSKNLA